MSELRPFARAFIGWIAVFTVPIGAIGFLMYLFLVLIGLDPLSACITETRGKISGVAGFDFEINETNCDFIGKEDWISIFVSRPGRPQKTLLFQYDPSDVYPFPVITPIGEHRVQISVPWIAEELFRRDGLKGLSVVYKIGGVQYPHVDPDKK
jgi:hypothetical protein